MDGREGNTTILGQVFSVVFILLLTFTVALVGLSFPAGVYAVFGPGSGLNPFTSTVHPFLLIGIVELVIPVSAEVGPYFVFLNAVYLAMFAYLLTLPRSPLKAISGSLREGVGALATSPFLLAIISFSFLVFTASFIDSLAPANPPPTSLLSLTQAPLVEELGFRVVLIGVFAAVLSLGLPWKKVLGVLWRPSSAYSGRRGAGAARVVVIALLFVSSLIFGWAHILNGWSFSKLYEATYGGLVLGYLYIRFGFVFAVLAHWGVDYFGSVFAYFGQTAYGVSANARPEFFLQAAVDYDMLELMGLASFLFVVFLWLNRLTKPRVDKDLVEVVLGL